MELYDVLETPQGILATLTNLNYIKSYAYERSDFDAIHILVDLQNALKNIELTEKQRKAIELVCIEGMTQKEAGDIMGISQQAVGQLLHTVARNIADELALQRLCKEVESL